MSPKREKQYVVQRAASPIYAGGSVKDGQVRFLDRPTDRHRTGYEYVGM